jgi:signal transduction histidine kinase
MDVRTISSSRAADGQGSTRILIDQGELRSLLSNLSHELCRPLVCLRAGFDLLLGESSASFTPDQRGHLLTMVTLCDDLLQLTRSYLDYAGIVQGSRPLCLGGYTIGALIHEIDRQFAPIAAARQVHWESCADSPETLVITDASLCQQIVGNLVSNALKYTPVGGQVRVVGQPQADSWSVTISDSGPGIPADALDQVFEPFFRLARDEHSGIEGNGLGLAICRELVAQLHGGIVLNSVLGQGTAVSVHFPLALPGTTRPSAPPTTSHVPPRDRAGGTHHIDHGQSKSPASLRGSDRSTTIVSHGAASRSTRPGRRSRHP